MKEKLRKPLTALMMAWGTYLAIPCPYKVWDDALRPWQIVCLPPVGLVVGGIWALCAGIFAKLGFTGFLAAAILAAVPFLVTGFFHLDGFLDCCDAILSRRDLATRQKILKDSRVGAFAVVSAVLLFLLSFAALADCSFSLIWRALLFSTETGYGAESEYPEGLYAHGEYPFVLYKYRDAWRKPFGTGLIHDYYDTQTAIDRYAKYIDDNARESSVQRHFIRRGSGVNPDDVADMRKTIIEWEGNDIREVMQTVQAEPINGQVYEMMRYLADTMKQDCGQNQFTRGEGGLNVTAGTAIHYLQEAGGKITRWHSERFKDAFRRMIEQILWVLSEYMEPGRKLRIIGGWNSNGGMRERIIELVAPDRRGGALPRPAYTVRVQVQRGNPNQIQTDNEFLMQAVKICADAGTPLPPETVIRLMEGYRSKEGVLRAIRENGSL